MEEDVSVNHGCFLFSWPLFDFLLLLFNTAAGMYILPDTRVYSIDITMLSLWVRILSRWINAFLRLPQEAIGSETMTIVDEFPCTTRDCSSLQRRVTIPSSTGI